MESTGFDERRGTMERASDRLAATVIGAGAGLAALPAAVAAMPFWVVGAATRFLARTLPLEPPMVHWSDLVQYAPEIGCAMRPNLDVYGRADGAFRLTTDAEGWRGQRPLDDADLVVFGDSFAFGHGVDDEDMFTNHTGDVVVKGIGSDAYSMVHGFLWMQRLRDRLAGRQIVWLIYLGNDLHDNLRPNYFRWRMPYLRWRDSVWEIATDHVSDAPWPFHEVTEEADQLAALCTAGFEQDRAVDAAAYLIEQARDLWREVGSELTVITVPRRAQIDPALIDDLRERSPDPTAFDVGSLDRRIDSRCNELGVPFVALADLLAASDYQERDIHWKPAGHRRFGAVLEALARA